MKSIILFFRRKDKNCFLSKPAYWLKKPFCLAKTNTFIVILTIDIKRFLQIFAVLIQTIDT